MGFDGFMGPYSIWIFLPNTKSKYLNLCCVVLRSRHLGCHGWYLGCHGWYDVAASYPHFNIFIVKLISKLMNKSPIA